MADIADKISAIEAPVQYLFDLRKRSKHGLHPLVTETS